MPADELYSRAVKVFGQDRTYLEPDLRSAITYSMEQCTLLNQLSEGISSVVVTGSVVTAGESRKILRSIVGRNEGSL
jgi:dihydrofolate synthase/folylpolyglutamate synthase